MINPYFMHYYFLHKYPTASDAERMRSRVSGEVGKYLEPFNAKFNVFDDQGWHSLYLTAPEGHGWDDLTSNYSGWLDGYGNAEARVKRGQALASDGEMSEGAKCALAIGGVAAVGLGLWYWLGRGAAKTASGANAVIASTYVPPSTVVWTYYQQFQGQDAGTLLVAGIPDAQTDVYDGNYTTAGAAQSLPNAIYRTDNASNTVLVATTIAPGS
jgi:hypothetical protein